MEGMQVEELLVRVASKASVVERPRPVHVEVQEIDRNHWLPQSADKGTKEDISAETAFDAALDTRRLPAASGRRQPRRVREKEAAYHGMRR